MISYILCDIEGTTTPISFVHEILFPFSAKHLDAYINAHLNDEDVKDVLTKANDTAKEELGFSMDRQGVIAILHQWIREDRKHPALKKLQGMIWEEGYEAGAFTSQIYDDVPKQWRAWKEQVKSIGIYSSGSVEAQKLLFRYTDHGDLTGLLSHYFDTAMGAKRERPSYERIVQRLKLAPEHVLFLSDIPEELKAAKEAGLQVAHIVRPGTKPSQDFVPCKDFFEVDQRLTERLS